MNLDFLSVMDCGDSFCMCQICADNEANGGTCTHCFTCVNGYKADGSKPDCFMEINR